MKAFSPQLSEKLLYLRNFHIITVISSVSFVTFHYHWQIELNLDELENFVIPVIIQNQFPGLIFQIVEFEVI